MVVRHKIKYQPILVDTVFFARTNPPIRWIFKTR